VKYVLAGSGHIAGVVNPPAAGKYQYWASEKSTADSLEAWLETAQEHAGSWWPHWREWLGSLDPEEVPARQVGTADFPALEDAPGSYVMVKS